LASGFLQKITLEPANQHKNWQSLFLQINDVEVGVLCCHGKKWRKLDDFLKLLKKGTKRLSFFFSFFLDKK
jgi:hypothetical protein